MRLVLGTGAAGEYRRMRRYFDTRCRVAAFRHRQLADAYCQPWQRRALAEGWRLPPL